MDKHGFKSGASKPMGAGRMGIKGDTANIGSQDHVLTAKEKIKQLNDLAKKLKMEPAQRKAFVAQGVEAIERQEAERHLSDRIEIVLEELQPLMDKHGIENAHIVFQLPVSEKEKKLGVRGWSSTAKVAGPSTLELLGVMTHAMQQVSQGVGGHKIGGR